MFLAVIECAFLDEAIDVAAGPDELQAAIGACHATAAEAAATGWAQIAQLYAMSAELAPCYLADAEAS